MSLCRIYLKKLVCQATNQALFSFERHFGYSSQWFRVPNPQLWNPVACEKPRVLVAAVRQKSNILTTDKQGGNMKKRKLKEPHDPGNFLGNVGNFIPYDVIEVIDENGVNLGNMGKVKVIKLMQATGLKLVQVNKKVDPPVYRLMTGKQLFEEQIKQRAMQKMSPGSIPTKEMSFSSRIGENDIETKKRQLLQWLGKKYRVELNIAHSDNGMDTKVIMKTMLDCCRSLAVPLSQPMERKNALFCILRPLTEEEIKRRRKQITTEDTISEQSPHTEITNS